MEAFVMCYNACECVDIGQDTCGYALFFFVAPPRRQHHKRVVPASYLYCRESEDVRKNFDAPNGQRDDVDPAVEKSAWVAEQSRTFCCRVTDDAFGVNNDPAGAVSQNILVV